MRAQGRVRLEILVLFSLAEWCVALKALGKVACNGDPGLCDLRVDQVTWAGTHNADAAHLRLNGLPLGCITDNHEHHVVTELGEGLRFFDVDTCYTNSGELYICHGPAYGVFFKPEMENVKKWLDDNPNELIVLSFVNANTQTPGDDEKYKMVQLQSKYTTEVFGDMLMIPEMKGGILTSSWPKLGDLVKENKRVIVLWGKALYFHIFNHDKTHEGFRDQHIWFQKYWTMTYNSDYKTMDPASLAYSLESFCDDPADKTKFDKGQPMILVDAYLTFSPKRKTFSYCNLDMAAEVNPILLDFEHENFNPLIWMQDKCWKNKKQVSLISMDFTQYFPLRLDRIAVKLNEENVARYGFIGGKVTFSGQGNRSKDDVKAILAELAHHAGGGAGERISVDGDAVPAEATERRLGGSEARRLSSGVAYHFSINAPATNPLEADSNQAILKAMKEASNWKDEVTGISAVCRDPGMALSATRNPAAVQESFDEGEEVTFVCETGLIPHGSLSRKCKEDGTFSGIQPSCLEAWTQEIRVMPLWVKILLLVLGLLGFLACIGGCIYCCVKRRGYKKLPEDQ